MVTEARQYEILGLLGAGSYGTVYKARYAGEHGFTKEVALKVLNPQVEDVAELAERLRDEARMLGLVRHRAIVQVDRLIRVNGRWAVIMECVDGLDLAGVLRGGPLPVGAALEITAEVAGALHAAWTQPGPDGQPLRLLHRDLKPSNIVLTRHAEVKVLDFGVARADFASREARTRSLVFGTPAYMPPERLDFQADGPEGDVYALSAMLFEMLTGQRLGLGSANPAKHQLLLDEARTVFQGIQEVSAEVAELVLRGLAFAREARPTVGELGWRLPELSRGLEGPTLRAWAERALPRLLAARGEAAAADAACEAQTISGERRPLSLDTPISLDALISGAGRAREAVSADVGAPLQSGRARRSSAWWIGAGGVGALAVLVGAGGLVAAVWLGRRTGSDVAPVETQAVATSPEPAPAFEQATQVAVGNPPPVEAPRPGSPKPPPPKRATLLVQGDALRVELVPRGRSSTSPLEIGGGLSASVGAGEYNYIARFERFEQPLTGCISLQPGAQVSLSCDAGFGNCMVPNSNRCTGSTQHAQ